MNEFTAYLDTKANTTEVYLGKRTEPTLTLKDTKTIGAAKGALKRKGFTVTEQDEYPYGIMLKGRTTS